jgi:prephenate dehydratase
MKTDNGVEPAEGAAAVAERRRGIDRIDRTIVALMAERERLDGEIGDLQRVSAADAAYQGAPGAFSEHAALTLLGADARLEPCETIDEALDALANGRARAAVVPIENTLAGSVPGCADALVRRDVHIAAECILPIRHALIASPGAVLADIRRVLSHPVALAQCVRFFQARPEVKAVPVFDTAGAVASVVQRGRLDEAAIGGLGAASRYGGDVLAEDVQDRADNATRFLLVRPGAPAGGWDPRFKTTIVCVLGNEPGALVRALMPFSSRGLNLSRIESHPTRETPFEYAFHLDVAPAGDAARLGDAIDDLRRLSRTLRVLGHYEGSYLFSTETGPAVPGVRTP